MSLLDELQSIDLSGIVSAKGSIKLSVNGQDIAELVSKGPAQAALAGLGAGLAEVQGKLSSPEALVAPLADALQQLADRLLPDDLPIEAYAAAVREGAGTILHLLEGFTGKPEDFGKVFGLSIGDVLHGAQGVVDGFSKIGMADLPRFTQLLADVESGVPHSPQAFAELAVEVLLPFPKEPVLQLRTGVDAILDGVGALSFDTARCSGLAQKLDALTAAAAAGNEAAVKAALDALAVVRASTVGQLQDDLRALVARVDKVRVPDVFGTLAKHLPDLKGASQDVLHFMEQWRARLAQVRAGVDRFDAAIIAKVLQQILDVLEAQAKLFAAAVDRQVLAVKAALRGLFARLPVAKLRQKLTDALLAVAAKIREARIERFAEDVLALLDKVRQALAGDLAGEVRAALEKVKAAIEGALDTVLDALETIRTQVDAVAGQAQSILGRAADALAAFQTAMTNITATIEGLGLESAGQQVVDTLSKLRETAEKLLSAAPLPDAMRPVIDQMTATLEGLDFDVVFKPVNDALAQLQIPDDATASLKASLAAAADAVSHLIPQQLIDEIDAEVAAALQVFRGFDPAALLPDVHQHLQAAADAIRKLKPSPAVAQAVHAPFAKLMEAVDAAQPARLLAPVIAAWDEALGSVSLPEPGALIAGVRTLLDTAGGGFAKAVTAPIGSLMGSLPSGGASAGAGGAPAAAGGASGAGAGGSGAASGGAASGGAASGGAAGGGAAGGGAAGGGAAGGGAASGGAAGSAAAAGGAAAGAGGSAAAGGGAGGGIGAVAGAAAGAAAAAQQALLGSTFRPGDVVRLFGYLPHKLRAKVAELEALDGGAIVHAVDRVCGGLARDLRSIPAALRGVEARTDAWLDATLEPLRQRQLAALLAVRGQVRAGTFSASLDLSALAGAGPGALREDLAETRRLVHQLVDHLLTGSGSIGAALEGAASALERCSLARIGADLDAFLAALDPEPIAAEMDAFVTDILQRAPALLASLEQDLRDALARLTAIIQEFNPGSLLQKYLAVLDVLREQVELLSPRRLAAELGQIHAAVRAAIAAYDPARFVEAVGAAIDGAADGLLALDPAALLGDLSFLDATIARLEAANPATALAATGSQLTEVGARLSAVDPGALLAAVEALPPRVSESVRTVVEGIRGEVVALLESIKFASAHASASVSAEVSAG